MVDGSLFAIVSLGVTLGLRHGVDWDHIAAITDITSSAVTDTESARAVQMSAGGAAIATMRTRTWSLRLNEGSRGFGLAGMYAVGHATVVVMLGLLAIWASAMLPDWIDPIMERIVGATLVLLGVWIIFSLWRYGSTFRLQSRWMVVFSLAAHGWAVLRSRLTGAPHHHHVEMRQYGPKTALAIGMIHGVGAETGSQALLLAATAGATTAFAGTVMLMAFVVGLLLSNSLVAGFSAFGFVSTATKRRVYTVVGVVAAVFSLVVGGMFLMGAGSDLPDLQQALGAVFGASGEAN
jgi:high-affinity nickel-transport protein